ncbi:MAG: hypothetical protein HXY44_03425 [Syntrophaceae bacterium]|nr:hypothetical protein [Syntrophaceae bacterium]
MDLKQGCCNLFILLFVAELVIGGTTASAADRDGMAREMKKLFPLKIGDYQSDGKDEFYDRQTAFRYMDGAAELYRSYGFKLLMVRRYVKTDHPPLIVETFDMGSSEDAFGVFSYETEDEEAGIGQGSDFGGGLLRFWKGKFFFNVYAEQESPLTKQDILNVGRTLADSIKQQGNKPKLINLLPQESLIERSIRYFHHHQTLNYHYFVSHQNILRLGPQTHASISTHTFQTKEKTFLLLAQYSSKTLAKGALQSFVKAYMPESPTLKVIQTENGRWTTAHLYKNYVMVVFDAPSKEKAERLTEATLKNLEEKK